MGIDVAATIAMLRGLYPHNGQRTPNVFYDPISHLSYGWPLNHKTEEPMGRSRQMGTGARTDNIGLVPQQGAATPLVMNWKGRILTLDQLTQMVWWWRSSDFNSIYALTFRDELYEVVVTDFTPQVVAVAENRSDLVNAPRNVWDYTLIMRVLTAFNGPWAQVQND